MEWVRICILSYVIMLYRLKRFNILPKFILQKLVAKHRAGKYNIILIQHNIVEYWCLHDDNRTSEVKETYTVWVSVCECVRVLPGRDPHCLRVVWTGSLPATDDCCLLHTSSHSSEHLHINTNGSIFTILFHTCAHTNTHSHMPESTQPHRNLTCGINLYRDYPHANFRNPFLSFPLRTFLQCSHFWHKCKTLAWK